MLPKAFTNLIIYFIVFVYLFLGYYILCTLDLSFLTGVNSLSFIAICKYDLENPFSVVNKSGNNSKQ